MLVSASCRPPVGRLHDYRTAAEPGALLIDSSTVDVADAREAHERAEGLQAAVLAGSLGGRFGHSGVLGCMVTLLLSVFVGLEQPVLGAGYVDA